VELFITLLGTPAITWFGLLVWKGMTARVDAYLSEHPNHQIPLEKLEDETLVPMVFLRLVLLDLKSKGLADSDRSGRWSQTHNINWGKDRPGL